MKTCDNCKHNKSDHNIRVGNKPCKNCPCVQYVDSTKIFIFSLIVLIMIVPFVLVPIYADTLHSEILCLQKIEAGIFDNCKVSNDSLQYTTDTSKIGIILSNTCLTLSELGYDVCPTYEELRSYYSNEIIVNPDAKTTHTIKTITITPNLHTYKITGSKKSSYDYDTNSFSLSFEKDRFVNLSCRNAIITSNLFLLGDTIWYMYHECHDLNTFFKTNVTMSQNATSINILDFKEYQHRLWVENVKKECIFEYGKC